MRNAMDWMMRARARWIAVIGSLLTLPLAGSALGQPVAPASPPQPSGQPSAAPTATAAGTGQGRASPSKSAKHPVPGAPKLAPLSPAPAAAQPGAPGKQAAKPKPAAKPKGRGRPAPRLANSKPGEPDEAARRAVSGAPPEPPPNESPELRAMRELDELLFPRAQALPAGPPWTATVTLPPRGPRVDASGMPPTAGASGASASEPVEDLSWLAALRLPDIPVRWEPPVVRYLEYYKNNPEGRAMVARWIQKSGRFRDSILRKLREHGLPEDVLWLALVESAFNPEAYSRAGAAGLWQFMPATGRIYGLTVNRSVDERLDPERSTVAALRHLSDLHQRFGSWELAFAAYNMGYGGLLATIRKYNTNDYWALRRLEAGLPYETALYVPKIVAMAVVARNCDVFGCDSVQLEPAESFDEVSVVPGTSLETVASAAGASRELIARLNPQLRGTRTPPVEQAGAARPAWTVYVPGGKGPRAQAKLRQLGPSVAPSATLRIRWGESTEDVARQLGTSTNALEQLNDLGSGESVRPGDVIFVPKRPAQQARPAPSSQGERLMAAVALAGAGPGDTRRYFYRVVQGDEVADVARVLGVGIGELLAWNHLDPGAALQGGMLLQVFLRPERRPTDVLLREETEVDVVGVGSEQFFAYHEGRKGRRRIEVTAQQGDSWDKLARRYGVTLGQLERINQRSRTSALAPGDKVVIYVANRVQGPAKSPTEPPEAPDDGPGSTEPYDDDSPVPAPADAPAHPPPPARG